MLSSMATFAAAASGVDEADAAVVEAEAAEPNAVLLACGSLRLLAPKGGVSKLPGYDSGGWWVQDAAATVAAKVTLAMKPAAILDACAAPGGKTMQLAAAPSTKNVVALEKNFKRAKRLRENLARTGLDAKIDVVIVDALDYTGNDETFDAILVDAPCSCSGTARHHPDVLRSDADVPNFVILQAKLLDQCWRQTKVGA
jgi:16S rRNA (cytosine967-C5)-methyltransferase